MAQEQKDVDMNKNYRNSETEQLTSANNSK